MIASAARRRRTLIVAGIALLALLLVGGAVMVWKRGDARVAAVTSTVPAGPRPATIENPRTVFMAPFTVESPDPLVVERANAVRLGALEMLRAMHELRVVDTAAPDAAVISARVRNGPVVPSS